MCYEIICAWIALTPIFLIISVCRASRTSLREFCASVLDNMIALYGLSFYATILACALFAFAMIPIFLVVVIASEFIEINGDNLLTPLAAFAVAVMIGSHLYLGYSVARRKHSR